VLNSDNFKLDYRFDYYMYGQFMKFIRPGAVRVHSNQSSELLPNCAARNPDGSIVLVVVNRKPQSSKLDIECNGMHLTTDVLGNSVVTYRWDGSSN
jgi:O-glycosyl hydrolase